MPKISVVMPVCNVEKYLERCLESALSQSVHDIEIICINDGSTDSSLAILRSYEAKDSRIKVIDKANAGYGAAMNDGLAIATGEYVAILESDDRVCDNAWETLYAIAEENDLDFVRGDYYRSNEKEDVYFNANQTTSFYCPDTLPDPPHNEVITAAEYPRVFYIFPSIWTGLYRRSFLTDNDIVFNETPGASFQDTSFAFKIWVTAKRAMLVDVPIIYYTVDNVNSSVKSSKKVYAVCDEMDECQNFLSKRDTGEVFYKALSLLRYKTYKWNLTRIADEFADEFKNRMWAEMRTDWQNGYCDPLFFRRSDYERIREIAQGDPAVSVIIPVHNAAPYLRECLDSVLFQSVTSMEIICVDDGSEDDSLSILEEYKAKDERVRVIAQPHSNAGHARNEGMAIARGTYLAFLDADDYYESGFLGEMVDLSDHFDLDVALCRAYILDDKTKVRTNHRKPMLDSLKARKVYSADDLWGYAFRYSVGWPWDKLFRRSFINEKELEFQELASTNDAYFVYSALAMVESFAFIDNRLVNHRVNNLNSIENTRNKSWDNLFVAIEAIGARLKADDRYKSAERDFDNWIAEMCVWNLSTLRSSRADFYEYVRKNYASKFASSADGYFYSGDYQWRFRVWEACDYDLAKEIFEIRESEARLSSRVEGLKEEKKQLEGLCRELRRSTSYRVGNALCKPAKRIKGGLKRLKRRGN